mgnify:CR=1 FL=1|tara:strand:- start:13279 stop:14568 length:1290 start_codon:yes stop_codon:yes gene_type:complete
MEKMQKLKEASIKGQNRKTGEKFGMVIGSDKKDREGNFELTIRVMYSSRISAYKLTFNSNNELINIIDYGYSMDGNPPDVKGSGSGKSVKLDKRKTIIFIAKLTSPAFANKIYKHLQKVNESVNEAFVVAYGKGPKPIKPAFAAYADKKMAQKFMGDMKKDGYKVMMTQRKIKGVDESINEISAEGGLKRVIKGQTREVEGIKVSKEMAQAMLDWFNSSPYGRKYPKAKKGRLHISIGIMLSFGLERYAKHKGAKQELKYLKSISKTLSKKDPRESANEAKYNYKADALTAYFKGKIDAKELDSIARNQFKSGIATKKELSNFLSNKFTQGVMSDTYGIPAGTLVKRVRGLMKFAEGISEDKKQVKDLVKKVKSEKIFYDVLSTMEKKFGKRKYRMWLEKSLKDFGENPKHYDYRTNAAIEEKLFQLGK